MVFFRVGNYGKCKNDSNCPVRKLAPVSVGVFTQVENDGSTQRRIRGVAVMEMLLLLILNLPLVTDCIWGPRFADS